MDYQERLLKLDKEAEELVQNLTALKEKALLFDTAQQGLNSTRENIDELVRECSALSSSLKDLVAKLDKLNTPTINEKLDYAVVNTTKAINSINEISNILIDYNNKYIDNFDSIIKTSSSQRKLLMILLAVSIGSLILSIIGLLL